jgi:penicillin-binding protein 1A
MSKMKPKDNRGFRKWIVLLWLAFASPFLGLALLVLIASQGELPDTEELANPKTNLATEVYTQDKKVIGRYYRENRSDVLYENLPPHLVQALIATEDERFMSHSGVDFIGLGRAVAYMGKKGGGSTITQQLAKQLFTAEYEKTGFWERAVLQKPREWIIAARLERQYTKEEIIALYLNRYDFLNQAVGIKSAANVYFNKPPDSLQLHESAMLVGMLKNSALFNPLRRDSLVRERRNVVLGQMVKNGFITKAEADSVKQLPLGLDYQRVSHDEGSAPYFREILRKKLKEILEEQDDKGNYVRVKSNGKRYDPYTDGLKVYTTIDSRMQQHAEWAVARHLNQELQQAFWKDLKKRKPENYPFFNGIAPSLRESVMNKAIKESERYRIYTGKVCPACKRPAAYIKETDFEGKPGFVCDEHEGGCSHAWAHLNEEDIAARFEEPAKMRVYVPGGSKDTVLSPIDSIKYHKAIIHAGLMSIDPRTGHVKAWVGGIDYKYFQFDNVFLSKRQVGSTFKPFVYALAIRRGLDACTELPNTKICIDMPDGQPAWCPDNSDFKYGDMVTMQYALANSINTITAFIIKKYGPEPVMQLARDMGITSNIPAVPSIALGVGEVTLFEMVSANSTFANKGVYIEPTFITRIEDKNGTAIWEAETVTREALDEVTAFRVIEMLKGVVDGAPNPRTKKRSGTGVRLRYDNPNREYDGYKYPVAGKTGTTQGNTDGWFIGMTPDLVTGVWVGAQDPSVRFSTTDLGQGANTGLPIWGYYMKRVMADPNLNVSKGDFEAPQIYGFVPMNCAEYKKGDNLFGPAFESGELDTEELFN